MIEIAVDKNTPITTRMKLIANELDTKSHFIEIYDEIHKSSSSQESVSRLWIIKTAVIATIIRTLKSEKGRKYFALSEVTKAVIEKKYCSKGRLSVIISEFLKFNLFYEIEVFDKKLNRKFLMITFPETVEELESSVQNYIKFLIESNKVKRKTPSNAGEVKNRSKAITKNISKYTSTQTPKEKNVVVLNEGKGTSLLSILSSICPVETTSMQDGTLLFKTPSNSKNISEVSSVDYKARTWSDSNGIMKFEDLKVYYALISLIYHAHLARFNEYYYGKAKMNNLTHFNIDNILSLTTGGKTMKFGGAQRVKCRESLDRIYKTIIELRSEEKLDLSHIASSGDTAALEATATGAKITPLEFLFPVQYEKNDKQWDRSTMDYIVKLPEDLFAKLFTSKFHWVFPPSSLIIDELMFSLYHFIRTNWKSSDKVNGGTSDERNISLNDFYYQHQSPSDTFNSFLNKLNSLLIKLSKYKGPLHSEIKRSHYSATKVPYRKEFKLKLFGYICFIDIENKLLNVELKEELFYEALEMGSSKRKTPTISNRLAHLNYSELLTKGKLSKDEEEEITRASNLSKQIVSKSAAIAKKIHKIIPVSRKSFGIIEIQLGSKKDTFFHLTLLSDNDYIDTLAKELSQMLAISMLEISSYLHNLKSKIPKIYNSKRIDTSDLQTIYEKYLTLEKIGSESISTQVDFFDMASNEPRNFSFMLSMVS